MSARSDSILADALEMPEEARAMIAERLIASLDHQRDSGVELAWQQELVRRISDIDSGRVGCLPWETVRARLRRSGDA